MKKKQNKVYCEKQKKMITGFEHRWGINARVLADIEGVTTDAIHMRVLNWGTPFKRRAKITIWEEIYGKTLGQMALEEGLHPVTLANKHYKLGNVYAQTDQRFAKGKHSKSDWTKNPRFQKMIKPTYFTLEDIL